MMKSEQQTMNNHFPQFHPDVSLLMDYAAGTLNTAENLIIACHLALCPECIEEIQDAERMAGCLISALPPAPVSSQCRAKILAGLDIIPTDFTENIRSDIQNCAVLPLPIISEHAVQLDKIAWKEVMRGVAEYVLSHKAGGSKASLLKINGGFGVPTHTHSAEEYTLVLCGSFSDDKGCYRRGDFIALGPRDTHRPIADIGPDCLCLTVTSGPLRLTGTFLRLLNPFIRH